MIDGPSPDILGTSGLAVARDGTGGLIYLKSVSGVAHVFLSRLLGGRFQAPAQADEGLSGASSQPVIAAANPGQLIVAFVNGGQLYVVSSANALTPLSAPLALVSNAVNPSLSMTAFGKAYLAFTAADGSGSDVRTAYYNRSQWALENAPLNVSPGDHAGSGTGRPQVTASGDGVAIVAWGENGHVYVRRVWGTSPSVAYLQADVASLNGAPELSAGEPAIAAGGDSSYAAVAFRETFAVGSARQSRVLMNRLHAGRLDGIVQTDSIATPGVEGADQPQVAVTEYGSGFVTSEHDQSHNVYATPLANNELPAISEQVNGQIELTAPDAVPATAGLISTLIAWQQNPGSALAPEIRVRYAPDGATLGAEQVVSAPSLGPTDADLGLTAGGDVAGDAAIAWVQGAPGSLQIVAAQLYQPPGGIAPSSLFSYSTSPQPLLSWSTASEQWGAPTYTVTFDGAQIATTTANAVRTSAPVSQGRHGWRVIAANQAGLSGVAATATVFVDSVAPRVSVRITGLRRVGATLRIHVLDTDSPPGVARSQASGIVSAQVRWGDGSNPFIGRRAGQHLRTHVYRRRRRYLVTVIVKDRAGNVTVVQRRVTIRGKLTASRAKPRRRHKKRSARRR